MDSCGTVHCLAAFEVISMNDSEFVRKDEYEKDTDIIASEINNTNKRLDDVKDFMSWTLATCCICWLSEQFSGG